MSDSEVQVRPGLYDLHVRVDGVETSYCCTRLGQVKIVHTPRKDMSIFSIMAAVLFLVAAVAYLDITMIRPEMGSAGKRAVIIISQLVLVLVREAGCYSRKAIIPFANSWEDAITFHSGGKISMTSLVIHNLEWKQHYFIFWWQILSIVNEFTWAQTLRKQKKQDEKKS